jgi:hypothetical protein
MKVTFFSIKTSTISQFNWSLQDTFAASDVKTVRNSFKTFPLEVLMTTSSSSAPVVKIVQDFETLGEAD